MRSFETFDRLLAAYPPAFRCLVDAHGDGAAGEWRLLALEVGDRNEQLNGYDPVLDFEPPKSHHPSRRSVAANSTNPSAVVLSSSDPLKRIPPREYVEAMTGERCQPAALSAVHGTTIAHHRSGCTRTTGIALDATRPAESTSWAHGSPDCRRVDPNSWNCAG